ncbi:Nif11-like leader peptide family natural product precursor [Rhizobium sp. CSW-27]|uniref:Nif11-like leader peptide family natural product precursor n=1 Tax=Rhizobium sp. CSW-27 TaxID=2839985 RepID=UPI001C022822|nr:Nif11-like leader peptide family natural product precursor [Rhizobium sp. CSW-27]MBT9369610.1 Nif11-like leader peptide family natural product precursor [Rhizobium sp. CSW-27]
MSFSDLQRFCVRLRADRILEARIAAAMQQGTAAVVAVGKRAGYSFSEEELSVTLAAHEALRRLTDTTQGASILTGGLVPALPLSRS